MVSQAGGFGQDQWKDAFGGASPVLPPDFLKKVPPAAHQTVANMTETQQRILYEDFKRNERSTVVVYLVSIAYFHYFYLGKGYLTFAMWVVAFLSVGVISVIWWLVDLFRIQDMIDRYHQDLITNSLRDMKSFGQI